MNDTPSSWTRGIDFTGSVDVGQDLIAGDKIVNITLPAPAPTSAPAYAFRVLTIVARPLNVPDLPDIADVAALVNGLSQVDAPVKMNCNWRTF